MPDPLDLSGRWNGTYAYPAMAGPATPFLAEIEERNGSLGGGIIEPDTLYGQATVEATISGHRGGAAVDFTKIYLGPPQGYEHPVDYVGKVSADGLSIAGVWGLLDWNGTFEMHRDEAIEDIESAEGETARLVFTGER